MKVSIIGSVLIALWLVFSLGALACPFCSGTNSDFLTRLQNAKAVCTVEKVAPTKYKVLTVCKGKATPGRVLIAADPRNIPKGTRALLLSTAGSPTAPFWSDPVVAVSDVEMAFALKALKLQGAPPSQTWNLAVDSLEGPSDKVNEACYNILARLSLDQVKKIGARVGVDRLRTYIDNEEIPETRRALYVLMSLSGLTAVDKAWLSSQLFTPPKDPYSPMVGPLVLGYTQVAGKAGLEDIQRIYLKPSHSFSEVYQPIRALAMVGENTSSKTLKEGILELFRAELGNPDRASIVLPALAVWKDYSVAPVVERLARQRQDSWTRIAVVRYFRSFASAESKAALVRLKAVDKTLVERVKEPFLARDL